MVCAIALGISITLMGLPASVQKVLNGPDGTLGWNWSLSYVVMAVVVAIVLWSQLVLAVSITHGTILRAFNRQPMHGRTKLEGTGKSNLLLKVLGDPNGESR